jgi:hypothetical protein
MPKRNTHLQVFLLLLLRDWARAGKKSLYVAFLDIRKAFDTIDHEQLLLIMEKLQVPEALIWAVQRLLTNFRVDVMGYTVKVDSGTFQGGNPSPFLCLLFLVDLINMVNEEEGIPGVELPWLATVAQHVIRILLFADDVAIPQETIPMMQKVLHLVASWARYRKITWAYPKLRLLRLAREPADRSTCADLPALEMDGHSIPWSGVHPYLGHPIYEAPYYRKQRPRLVPFDEAMVKSRLHGVEVLFTNTAHRRCLHPPLLRVTIHQTILAKVLYPTILMDIDYERLDSLIYMALRRVLHLPVGTSKTFIQYEMGLWPTRYYAHRRVLRFIWRLRHEAWTQPVFQHWLEGLTDHRQLRTLEYRAFNDGILRRFTIILERYNLTWMAVDTTPKWKDWIETIAYHLSHELRQELHSKALKYDFPLIDPYEADGETLKYKPPTMTMKQPPYMKVGGDLATAALRAHYFRLRCLPGSTTTTRGRCRFCRTGNENCLHLLECSDLPDAWFRRRSVLFEAIADESKTKKTATRSSRNTLRDYFYSLRWPNQSRKLLIRSLAFYRDIINMYAGSPPAPWEGASYEPFPVPRIRTPKLPTAPPSHRK